MSNITLGIIGGGQLGSMLAIAAKKLGIKIIISIFFINLYNKLYQNYYLDKLT